MSTRYSRLLGGKIEFSVGIKLPGRSLGKIGFRVSYAPGRKDRCIVFEGIGCHGFAIMLCGLADSFFLFSAHRFFIMTDNRLRPAAVK
jgi:hypothetical protein